MALPCGWCEAFAPGTVGSSSFVQSGRVTEAARKAAPRDANEQQQMQQAEEAAKAHAKDEDPTVPGANASHQPQGNAKR